MFTMKMIAANAHSIWANGHFYALFRWKCLLLLGLWITGCATPGAPAGKAMYDLGPSLQTAAAPATPAPALALSDIEASAALESTAMLYRLAYADAQQLQAYTLARWSVPPAQLLRARLRDALSARGPVVHGGESANWRLTVELDEFSHWFDSPSSSQGLVRLRATLSQSSRIVAQSSFTARQAAPTADAAGAAKALRASSDELVQQLLAWVAQHQR